MPLSGPLSDAAFITTYLVSKFAREDVTVILSGVGGWASAIPSIATPLEASSASPRATGPSGC